VLVSADSIESLKLAFPNYYLDTEYFLKLLNEITMQGIYYDENGQLALF
jgi:hypothetical protein